MSLNLNLLPPPRYTDEQVMARVAKHLNIEDGPAFAKWAKAEGFQTNVGSFFTMGSDFCQIRLRDLALLCEKLGVTSDYLLFGKDKTGK